MSIFKKAKTAALAVAETESCEEVPCPNPDCEGKIGTEGRVTQAPGPRVCWSCGMTVWFEGAASR